MIKDPKQIVTPYAFSVHPDLLGLPLATPKRRLAALSVDLLIASILTGIGNVALAFGVACLFFWMAVRTKGKNKFKNFLRYTGATFASFFIFAIAVGIIEGMDPSYNDTADFDEIITANGTENVDWAEFGTSMMTMDYSDPEAVEKGFLEMAEQLSEVYSDSDDNFLERIPEEFESKIQAFRTAIIESDTLKVDSLRTHIASIIAANEFNDYKSQIFDLKNENEDLEDINQALRDDIENPSIYKAVKRALGYMGLSLGWIGIYFITTIAFFRGQTLGKRLLKIRVIRLNNKPIGLFFAFERFGGYAAGIATGLIGFFQMFWDSNRQAIHDKIASTVVIDLRESKMKETEDLRKEVKDSENLLSYF